MESNQKKVSVVLTTYNAKERLIMALTSYKYQRYPKEKFEIVVVDDGSTDGTYEHINALSFDINLKLVRSDKNLGRAAARNRGITEAAGEIIIFSDSDMIADPFFIEKHVQHHDEHDNVFVGGCFWNRIDKNYDYEKNIYNPPIKTEDVETGSVFQETSRQIFADFYEQFLSYFGNELEGFQFPWMYFVVMNCSVKSIHLKEAGLFDEQLQGYGGEDEEMGYRLWKRGLKGIVDPTIKNFHQEHARSNKQRNESAQNINYIIQKHQDINLIMYYYINFVNQLSKSKLLRDIQRAFEEEIISPSFHQECLNEIFHYWKKPQKRNRKDRVHRYFIKEIRSLNRTDQYRQLAFFLNRLVLNNRR
ncbi:glycosyltransferase family 2 protein [Pseudalkalibacillus sp. SCS-8]|uniref:glycosyltransferase family 2 protein n=1 Tax=Pseudalkalibacillus nanhaiensis TaxID=3115291 RepID=UPI0032DB54B6